MPAAVRRCSTFAISIRTAWSSSKQVSWRRRDQLGCDPLTSKRSQTANCTRNVNSGVFQLRRGAVVREIFMLVKRSPGNLAQMRLMSANCWYQITIARVHGITSSPSFLRRNGGADETEALIAEISKQVRYALEICNVSWEGGGISGNNYGVIVLLINSNTKLSLQDKSLYSKLYKKPNVRRFLKITTHAHISSYSSPTYSPTHTHTHTRAQ